MDAIETADSEPPDGPKSPSTRPEQPNEPNDSNKPKRNTAEEITDPEFGDIPNVINGWVQHSTGPETLIEYWRNGGQHHAAKYEQLTIKELRNGSTRLSITGYDQFKHTVSNSHINTNSPSRTDQLWQQAESHMQEYPGGQFDGPPSFPEQVGEWENTTRSFDDPVSVTHWEREFGEAELIVIQTGIDSGYTHLTRHHEIKYVEPDIEPVTLAEEVPRTQAFEIALNTLEKLDAPVSELQDEQEQLQAVNGIGPAKSRYFNQLGILSVGELVDHISSEEHPVNSYHSSAVEKLLTKEILTDLRLKK